MTRALFAQTDEQRAMQETARRFATDRLAPGYQQRDKAGTFERGIIREMGALGLIGVDLPEELVGGGLQLREIGPQRLRSVRLQVLDQELAVPLDGVERSPQVVTQPPLKRFERFVRPAIGR